MKIKILCFIVILLSVYNHLFAQKNKIKDNFKVIIREVEGDLNNDGILDLVTVYLDKIDDTRPLRLQIFLSQPDKKLKLIVSTVKLIESMYPVEKNGLHNGSNVPQFYIEDGKLSMFTDIEGYKSSYDFMLKDNDFLLHHISRVIWDGKNRTYETKIDLIKKIVTKFHQELGSDEIFNKTKKTIVVNQLPKIQELTFSELKLY